MNLLPAVLSHQGSAVELNGRTLSLASRLSQRADGAELTLGIRPENIELSAEGMAVPVNLIEPLGSEMLVHGAMADGELLTVKLPSHTPVGDTISVSFPPQHLHLFDRASGLRIDPA